MFQAERHKMDEHLKENVGTHLNQLCELVSTQKKQIDCQREKLQLQKEHIQLQKEALALHRQEILEIRSRSANGEMIWRIANFNRKLIDAKSGRSPEPMISEAFYTDPQGYKVCAGIWLNGIGTGRGKYVSVGLQVSSIQSVTTALTQKQTKPKKSLNSCCICRSLPQCGETVRMAEWLVLTPPTFTERVQAPGFACELRFG